MFKQNLHNVLEFITELKSSGSGGVYVIVPFDIENIYKKKKVKIIADIEGEKYRGTLVRMGSEEHMLLVLKEIRLKIKKDVGDKVRVKIREDLEPRIVIIPNDVEALLEKSRLLKKFEALSYTHRKEYVNWINEAKKDETRAMRIKKLVTTLKTKK